MAKMAILSKKKIINKKYHSYHMSENSGIFLENTIYFNNDKYFFGTFHQKFFLDYCWRPKFSIKITKWIIIRSTDVR